MKIEKILKELQFKAVRSSGAGGQHVNKVASKVELFFNLENSLGLSIEEKQRLQLKLASRLTKDSTLIISCDESRSQHKNKELVIKRFFKLIKENLRIPKKRKDTKPSKAVIKKRVESKQRNSVKKALRKKPRLE
jgi:ribosome-associated protein